MTLLSRRSFLASASGCAASLAWPSHAQDAWPVRPIQVLVGFPAGGLHDTAARVVGTSLSKTLGVSVVVVPTPGAGGAIALQKLALAAADGYTLMYTPSPALLARPHQMSLKISYRDFAPVAMIGTSFPTISVKQDHRWKTFDDMRSEVAANPGKFSYATSGIGGLPHLAMEEILSALQLKVVHVPFQGTPQAIMAALNNDVDVVIGDLPRPEIRSLAVIGDERQAEAPDVPSTKELGLPAALTAKFMYIGPRGLPDAAVKAMSAALETAVADPAVVKHFRTNLITPRFEPADQMLGWWQDDEKRYIALIDRLELKSK
ncbi:MAG: Bug family tripartite tricarboxylate transporter substrate binding protein [Lautropia sp.]